MPSAQKISLPTERIKSSVEEVNKVFEAQDDSPAETAESIKAAARVARNLSALVPRNRTILLSSYGVETGQDATAEIQALESDLQDRDYVIFDVDCTYSGTQGIKTSKNFVTFEFRRPVNVTSLDHTIGPYFLQISGFAKKSISITSGDLAEGDNAFSVDDPADIRENDIVHIQSSEFFNGSGAAGDPVVNKSIIAKVREVVGSEVRVYGQLTMSIQAANITNVTTWRGGHGGKVITPKLIGPGIQATVPNANGAKGIEFRLTSDCYVYDMDIKGFQNFQLGFVNCFNSAAIGGIVSSGLTEYCETNFYGVLHKGGTNGVVAEITGINLRRVADTGVDDAAVNISHINITGIDCNGSAAGTHHAYNYTFSNLKSFGRQGGGFTFRAKNITGNIITGTYTTANNGMGFGGEVDTNSSCGTVDISGININALNAEDAVRVSANGKYKLSGTVSGGTSYAVFVNAERISGFKYVGEMNKNGAGIVFNSPNCTQLNNVKLNEIEFSGGTGPDIIINGPALAENAASGLSICDNTSDAEGQPLLSLISGYYEGLSSKIKNNKNTNRNTQGSTAIVDITGATFSVAPVMYGNAIINAGALDSRTEDINRIVGEYDSLSDIPAKTTLLRGCSILIADSAAGDVPKYHVTAAGTTGSLMGVTATTVPGDNTVPLQGNSGFDVDLGMIIVIPGAGSSGSDLTTKVKGIDATGEVITVTSVPQTAAVNAVVSYKSPTYSSTGGLV